MGKTLQELRTLFPNQAAINRAAENALRIIMRDGARTEKMTAAFGKVVEYRLPSGLGARFSAATNEFIGFLGRGI